MSMWLMYLVLKLDDVVKTLKISCNLCMGILVITLAVFVTSSLMAGDSSLKDGATRVKEAIRPLFKWTIPILIVSSLLYIVFPTTKQAAAIYFVPKVINNKQISKMPDKLVTLANAWMDEQIKSIKSK